MLFINLLLKFITVQVIDSGQITNKKEIAKNYLKGNFIIDLLACFPSLVTGESVDWVYYFKVLRFLSIEKLIKQIGVISSKLKQMFLGS
jgi:hypothetical protein